MVDRFQHLFDSLADQVVIIDQNLRITYANPAWLRCVALSPSQVLGQYCHKILIDSATPCDAMECAAQQVFRTGQASRSACLGYRQDVGSGLRGLSASPVLDEDGQVVEVALVFYPTEPSLIEPKNGPATLRDVAVEPAMQTAGSEVGLPAALDSILEDLRRVVAYDSASIALPDKADWRIIAGSGFPPELDAVGLLLPGEDEKVRWLKETRQPMVVEDVQSDPRWIPVAGAEYIRSWIGAPLLARGQMIGLLYLDKAEAGYYQPDDAQLVMAFANQVAVVIENARLFDRERQRTAQLRLLADISRKVLSILDPEALLEHAVQAIQAQFGYYFVGVLLTDPAAEYVVAEANSGPVGTGGGRPQAVQFRIGEEGITGHVAATGEAYLANEVYQDPYYIFDEQLPETRSELAAPIKVGDRIIGVLDINSDQPDAFGEDDLFVVQSLADQLALGLENARLFESTSRRVAELEAVRQASLTLTSRLELQHVLEVILETTLELLSDVRDAHIFLYQDGRLSFGTALWADGRKGQPWAEPRPDGLTYTVARRGESVFVPDMRTHPLFADTPQDWTGSIVGLPLRIGERVVGVMTVAYQQPRALPESELNALGLLADQAAIAIENARLFNAEHQSRLQLKSIQATATALSAELHLDSLLDRIVTEAAQAFNAEATCLMLWDNDETYLVVRAGYGLSERYTQQQRIPTERVRAAIASVGRIGPLYVSDLVENPFGNRELIARENIRSVLAVPLGHQWPIIGILNIYSKATVHTFTTSEIELAEAFAAHASVVIANARLYEETQQRLRELTLLFKISAAVSISLDTDEVVETTVTQLATALGTEGCTISAWDRERDVLVTLFDHSYAPEDWEPDPPGMVYPLSEFPASRQVLFSRQPRVIQADDPEADEAELALMADQEISSLLMVPMVVRDTVIGLLEVMEARQKRAFTATEINFCQLLANQAASALENARLFQETEARVRELTALAAVGQAVTTLELDDLLENIAENALLAAQAEISSVYLLDEDRELLIPKSVCGMRQDELGQAQFALGEGTIGQVAQSGEALIVYEAASDPSFAFKTEAARQIRNTLTVPLVVKGQVIGTLEVCNKVGLARFTATDERLLGAFAAQAAIAIENAQLFQTVREQRELAEALRQAVSVVGSTLDLEQVLDHILEQVSRVMACDLANVMLIEDDYIRVVRWRGYEKFGGQEFMGSLVLRLADTPTLRQMQESDTSLVVPDTATFAGWVHIPEEEWLRSYAGAPIRVRDQVVGFLNIDSDTPDFFGRTHADRLQAFADQVSLAIANAHLYQEVSHHLEEVLILNSFTRAAISTLDLDEVLRGGLSALIGVRNFERVHVLLLDREREALELHPALGDLFPQREMYRIPLGRGICGRVAETGQPLRVADVRHEQNYVEGYADTCSELAVPLRTGDLVIGVLDVQSTRRAAFTENDQRFLVTLAGQLSTIIENARLFAEAQQRVRELSALMQVSQALSRATDLSTILEIVLEETFALLEGKEASVILIDPPDSDRLRIVAERGLGPEIVEAFNMRPVFTHEGTYKRALGAGQIVEVSDTTQDPDFLLDVGSEAKAVTNIPLTTERGSIGLIAVDGLPKDDTTRRLLMALADMAAVAIDKERLRLETSHRLSEVTTLYTLATQITGSLLPETVMESIVAILKLTLDCRACSIFLLDPVGEHLRLEAGSGLDPTWKGVARMKVGEGVSGRAIAERRSVYVPDTQLEPNFVFFDPDIRSLLVVPLIVRDKAIGTLSIDDVKPNAFDDEVRLLTIAAAQAAVAIENAQLYESLQQSYADLEQAYQELRHLDQMKSEFVQNISHELRTPLTFIKGYIELLQDGDMGELAESQRKAMNIVAAKADVLARLVDDIISLQQAGRVQLRYQALPLSELGHASVQAARASAEEAGIILCDEIPDGLPPVRGDIQRLGQVFDNLLGNALKFSRAGDAITVRMREDGNMVRVEIEDTGIGIPADQLARIFERFYQVDGTTTRRYGGTGLGLAIVKQIVESHGGQVGVESELDEGSTFYFTIPVAFEEKVQGG